MATKLKPQGPKFKRFEFWIKVTKVTKSHGPFWQFTLLLFTFEIDLLIEIILW
ncbi:hypothetical protein Hanom_Chr08g00722861 [Helianthus anomalus]